MTRHLVGAGWLLLSSLSALAVEPRFEHFDGCFYDRQSGELWQTKTLTPGLSALDDRYYWYDPNPQNNGGVAGEEWQYNAAALCYGYNPDRPASHCNTHDYIIRINRKKLCGLSNWRLPTSKELLSLVDYRQTGLAIDPSLQDQTAPTLYFSGQTYINEPMNAWVLDFTNGVLRHSPKTSAAAVRLISDNPRRSLMLQLGGRP